MAKVFNVAADCKPDKHYMVNIDKKAFISYNTSWRN